MKSTKHLDESQEVFFHKEFQPKSSFVYCYFVEKKYANISSKKSEEKKALYEITFASDIQRFYYYPGTKDIYTFLGFTNQNQLEVAIFQPSLRKAALNRKFYYFPLQDLPSYLTPPVPKRIHIDETPKMAIYEPAKDKKISLFIFLEVFQPIDNLFYCYFEEKDIPSGFLSSNHLRDFSFAYQTVFDIQRFVYHPRLHKVFTFFGFLTRVQRMCALQNKKLQSSVKNNEIFLYKKKQENFIIGPIEVEPINSNNVTSQYLNSANISIGACHRNNFLVSQFGSLIKNPIQNLIGNLIELSNFQNFVPKENLIYICYIEKSFPCQITFKKIGVLNCLTNCRDIQQYCHFPHSKVVCSFFGFSNFHDLKNNFRRLSNITQVWIYPYLNLLNETTVENNDMEVTEIREFVPKKKLIYFYFHENHKENKNENSWGKVFQSFYAIYNAEDIQSSCYYPGTNKIYSFYGFKSKKLLLKAIKHSTFEFKDIYNLKIYNKKDKNDSSSQSDKTFLICNSCFDPEHFKNQFSKSIKKFYPVENLFYTFFVENSAQFDNYKILFFDTRIENVQRYRIYDGYAYSFIGFKDESERDEFILTYNDLPIKFYRFEITESSNNYSVPSADVFINQHLPINLDNKKAKNDVQVEIVDTTNYSNKKKKKDAESKNTSSPKKATDSKEQKQTTAPPIKINQNSNKSVYQIFEPKKNTFYLYIEELSNPNLKLSERSYRTIFGINFSTDIQRFHYLPGTNKIYTFIGFSNQQYLNEALNHQNLKTSSKHHKIFIFNAQEETTSNSQISKNKPTNNQDNKITDKTNQQTTASQTNSKNDEFNFSFENTNNKNNSISNTKPIINKSKSENDQLKSPPKEKSTEVNSKNQIIFEPKTIPSSKKASDSNEQKQTSEPPIKINQNSNKSVYRTFEPKKNTFYLYFEELSSPNYKSSEKSYRNIFGINFSTDIQRFHYLPGTNEIYTFIGFSSQINLIIGLNHQSLKSSAKNQKIFTFNTQEETPSNSKIQKDKPKIKANDKITDKTNQQTTASQSNSKNDEFNFSFENTNDKNNSISNTKPITNESKSENDQLKSSPKEKSKEINNKNQIIFEPKTIPSSKKAIDSNEQKQTSAPAIQVNQNSNKSVYRTFEPKKNTFYLYIEELSNPNLKLSEKSYRNIFGINFSTDIQRFHYLPGTNKIYTFIGFSNQQYLNEALNHQNLKSSSKHQKIFTYNAQEETPSNSKIQKDKPKIKANDKITDKTNQQTTTSQSNSKNDEFNFSFENTNDKNNSISNTKPITNESKSENDQLKSPPKGKSTEVNNKNQIIFEPKTIPSSKKAIDSNEQKQITAPAIQVNQNSNKSVYRTFEPKKNTFYLYIEELSNPNLKLSEKNYRNIFGINYSTDIQRFHYLPGTNEIYTFIGFSNQRILSKALNHQPLKSSSKNQKIFTFNAQEETTSNSQVSKIIPKINQGEKITDKSNQRTDTTQYNSKNDDFHFLPEKSQDKNTRSKDLNTKKVQNQNEIKISSESESDESENCNNEMKETEIIQILKDKDENANDNDIENESSLCDDDDDDIDDDYDDNCEDKYDDN